MKLIPTIILLTAISISAPIADDGIIALKFRPASEIGEHASEVRGPDGEPALEITGGPQRQTITLLICDHPNVSYQYRVRGRVKYKNVEGDGYLELLNSFGAQGTFFSRTLVDYDPMRKLTGSSDWREFELPFFAEPGMKPDRLTMNVVLPGNGLVAVTQPVLEQMPLSTEWWSSGRAGLIGGIAGTLMGLLGGLIGVMMVRTQTRVVGKYLLIVAFVLSVFVLLGGLAAVLARQPYHVYYPLLLIGLIGSISLGCNFGTIFQRLREDELRKMTSIDVD